MHHLGCIVFTDKNSPINNYLQLNIPHLFNTKMPAIDPNLLVYSQLPDIDELSVINPTPSFRRDVITQIAKITNSPEYLGRLLIVVECTQRFSSFVDVKGRVILDFECFDIKQRLRKASIEEKEIALKVLKSFMGEQKC